MDFKNNITLILFFIVVVLACSAFYLIPRLPKDFGANAQSFTDVEPDLSGDIICDEVIPVGSAFDHTKALMDDIYQQYETASNQLKLAIANLTSQIASLSPSGSSEVCDFKACNPPVDPITKLVRNQAPPLAITLQTQFFGDYNLLNYSLPGCSPTKCIGSPCADLTVRLAELKKLKETFKKMDEDVHAMLYDETEPIGYDYLISNGREKATDTITRPEKIKREIELARNWLTPAVGQRRSCAMTEIDRKNADNGDGGMWGPALCREARASNMYWPRPWSENCEKECTDDNNLSNECKECLADSKSKGGTYSGIPNLDFFRSKFSFLAVVNYQIYGMCKNECKNTLDEKCTNCLCEAGTHKKNYTQEECLAWLCGGSADNWVCCREVGVSRWQTPNDFANMEFYFPTLTGNMRQRARDVYKMINGMLENPAVKNAVGALDIPFTLGIIARETRVSSYLGVYLSEVYKIKDADRDALKIITDELKLNINAVLISKGSGAQWGGAMGPMQIMPSTWLEIKDIATNNSLSVLDPWKLSDSLLGAMLYLKNRCGALDNEEMAARKYFAGPNSKNLNQKEGDIADYAGNVMAYKNCFAKIISMGCFEDEAKQDEATKKACNDASLKEITECKGIVK